MAIASTKAPAKKSRVKDGAEVKTTARRATSRKTAAPAKDISASYNEVKDFEGQRYMGMRVGRSHKWYYDKGEWKETKITPDLWEISYAVTKRRAGRAPEGSGVPVGTEYHWYILAHQMVKKLNANDYSTSMTGLKFKLAHKRADKKKWSASAKAQRRRLVKLLHEFIAQLEKEPVPLEIEYDGEVFTGEAIPVSQTCHDGVCDELDITLNDKNLGILKCTKGGWKMDTIKDQKFVNAIGEEIFFWYE
jgi:hypothetical protein